jgi:hypothetical protein
MPSILSQLTTPSFAKAGIIALICGSLVAPTQSDPLYMPRTVKRAFANGTRSPDGRPGPNYWQNGAGYTIQLAVAPPSRAIRGTEEIVYANNSPDTLRALVIRLFGNIHKPGAPRDGGASADYLNSGVHIDAFTVNGQSQSTASADNAFTSWPVRLPAPLMPHSSVKLGFQWHYDISLEAGREGMLDSTTYYLAYFYPRVAVYDDYNGWDRSNFTDAEEFYNDFSNYDVSITAPANYIVWGTGTLTNADAVLQPAALQRYRASFTSDTTIHVATKAQNEAHAITAQQPSNTWHFTAHDITDVAFNVSDHYDWDAASVVVDDATHRRTSVQAAFNDTAADYHHMVHFAAHNLDWLSHNWPGVPYPYEKSTIVQGSADMEYPMMVNDGSNADTTFSRFVAAHEQAHTYFPFYMGINETRYAMMDEGWATTFEYLINQHDMGPAQAAKFYEQFRVTGWARNPSPAEDLPIITPEDFLKTAAWGDNAYGKASLGYLAVKDLLGDDMFKKVLQGFMDRWHGKHPIPWDFFNTVNDISGRNLNWFWRNWYFSNGYIDTAVRGVARANGGYTLTLANVGGMDAPVDVTLSFTDGTTQTVHKKAAIWQTDAELATISLPTSKTLRSLTVDGGIWMDANPGDNTWTAGQ